MCSALSEKHPEHYSKNRISELVSRKLLQAVEKWDFSVDSLLNFDLFLVIRNILTLSKA